MQLNENIQFLERKNASSSDVILSSFLLNSKMVLVFLFAKHQCENASYAILSCSSNTPAPQRPHRTAKRTIKEASWSLPQPAMAYVCATSILIIRWSPWGNMLLSAAGLPPWKGEGATPFRGHVLVDPVLERSHQSLEGTPQLYPAMLHVKGSYGWVVCSQNYSLKISNLYKNNPCKVDINSSGHSGWTNVAHPCRCEPAREQKCRS